MIALATEAASARRVQSCIAAAGTIEYGGRQIGRIGGTSNGIEFSAATTLCQGPPPAAARPWTRLALAAAVANG
jgi:hypothetical protein